MFRNYSVMRRVFISLAFALAISVSRFALPASAGDGDWNGKYGEGDVDLTWFTSNTSAKEFHIATAKEFAGLAVALSSDSWAYEEYPALQGGFFRKTIYLDGDIDLAAVEGVYWRPMGDCALSTAKTYVAKDDGTHFKGTLDGQGYEVRYASDPEEYGAGLFSVLSADSTVKNLSVDARISTRMETGTNLGSSQAGGIAITNNGGTISGCFVSADITSAARAGGVVALNDNGGTIRDCAVSGDFSLIIIDKDNTGNYSIGGVTAMNGITTSTVSAFIYDSSFKGVISIDATKGSTSVTSAPYFGGIAGTSSRGSSIENCSVVGDVLGMADPAINSPGVVAVAGIAGKAGGTIKNCSFYGSLKGNAFGGIVSTSSGTYTPPLYITDCVANINVLVDSTWHTSGSLSGGGIAQGLNNYMTIENCFASGDIKIAGDAKGTSANIAGIIGSISGRGVRVDNCVSDVNIGATLGGFTSGTFGGIYASLNSSGMDAAITNCVSLGKLFITASSNFSSAARVFAGGIGGGGSPTANANVSNNVSLSSVSIESATGAHTSLLYGGLFGSVPGVATGKDNIKDNKWLSDGTVNKDLKYTGAFATIENLSTDEENNNTKITTAAAAPPTSALITPLSAGLVVGEGTKEFAVTVYPTESLSADKVTGTWGTEDSGVATVAANDADSLKGIVTPVGRGRAAVSFDVISHDVETEDAASLFGGATPSIVALVRVESKTPPPTVVSVTPNEEDAAPLSGKIEITFSEEIGTAGEVSLNGGSGSLSDGALSDDDKAVYTISYEGLAYETTYTVNISGFKDIEGNEMDPDSTNTFTTEAAPTYVLTVTGGTGGGSYAEGAQATVTANAPDKGKEFDKWTETGGGTFADDTSATTTYTMPANDATVTATYKDAVTTPPTVTNVTPSGSDAPLSGKIEITFSEEIGTAGEVSLSGGSGSLSDGALSDDDKAVYTISYDGLAYETTYTVNISGFKDIEGNEMDPDPTNTFTTEAAPTAPTYTLTVTGGTGGGSYAEGDQVPISAGAPATGKEFDKWTTDDGGTFADDTSATTTYTMPGNAAAVTANYKDAVTTPPTETVTPEIVTPPEIVGDVPFGDGIETDVNPAAVTYEEDLPEALRDSGAVLIGPSAKPGDPLLADPDVVVDGMSENLARSVDLTEEMLPLPVFEATVSEEGNTALVTVSVDLSPFAGKKFGDLIVLKYTSDDETVALARDNELAGIVSGRYIFTDEIGTNIPDTSTIQAATTYFLSVAVEDNSVYDWDRADYRIVDPLVIAVGKEENGTASASKDTSIAKVWTEVAGKKIEGSGAGLIVVPEETVLTSLPIWITPTNAKAVVSPNASGDKYDFTNPRKFNVLAEDGVTSKDHTVTIKADSANDEDDEENTQVTKSFGGGGCDAGALAAIALAVGAGALSRGKTGKKRKG